MTRIAAATVMIAGLFGALSFSQAQTASSQVPNTLDFSAYVRNKENKELPNGKYEIRFAIYSKDRTAADAYPSNSDAGQKVWEETQNITIVNGVIASYLGSVNPLPVGLNFASQQYYLGIRIGSDSEMVPRKRIGAVPLAISSYSLQGAVIGTESGNIPTLGSGGKINIKQLPTGASGSKLMLADDSRLDSIHDQNTDLGTDALAFNIGDGTSASGNNFLLTVSSNSVKPAIRFNGTSGQWEFSDDGSSFTQFSSLGGGNFLPLSGGTMTGDIIFAGTQSFANLIDLGSDTNGNYVQSITNGNGISGGNGGSEGSVLTLALDALDVADGTGANSSFSGLEFAGASNNELTLLQGCANGQMLKWDDSSNVWTCSNDLGGGTAVINIKEGVTLYTGIDTLTFGANDFSVSQIGTEANVGVDYANSGITRRDQNETISGAWNFADVTIDGSLSVIEGGLTPSFHTIFQGGDQSGNITYVLPTAQAAGASYVLSNNGSGTLSWQAVSGVGGVSGSGVNGQVAVWNSANSITAGGTLGTAAFTNSTAYQAANSNLTSLAGLTYASGTPFVKMTGANTFALDTNTYLTSYTETDPRLPAAGTSGNLLQSNGTAWVSWTPNYLTANQTITLSGDVSGSGTTAITATVADDSHSHTSTTLPANTTYLGSSIDGTEIAIASQAQGDILYFNGTNWVRLAAGSTGQYLQGGSAPSWAVPAGAGDITDIGDCVSGACFTAAGTSGTSLYFYDADGRGQLTIANLTQARTYTLPDIDGTLTLLGNTTTGTGSIVLSADPIFTGDPLAPTPATVDNDTSIATTAFVKAQNYLISYTETDPRLPAAGTSGNLLQSNGTAWVSWTPNYLTANQTITLSGDVSGSGTTAITATVADDSHAHTSTTLPATISYLGSNIDSSEIADGSIAEVDLSVTNSAVAGYILSYDSGGGFSWISNSGGSGASKWTQSSGYAYLTNTTDDLVIGGSSATAPFFFDTSAAKLRLGLDGTSGSLDLFSEVGATDYTLSFQPSAGMTQNTTYIFPVNDGSSDQVMTTDGNGLLTWKTVTGIGGAGDITEVGDVTSGEAFTAAGTQGTSLYFYDAQGRGQLTIANLTAPQTYTLPDATGTVITTGNLSSITSVGTIGSGTWQGTAIADAYISSAATWNAKQNAYANLTSIGSLANGAGWLYNNGSGTFSYSTPTYSDVGAQQLNSNLTSLAGLTYASGTPFVKMTGANTFALDTNTYLTGNQNITLTGDVTGSGTTSIATTIADDIIDFTEIADSMTLDNNLTIASSASNYSINIDSNTLFVDTANNRLGIGTASPGSGFNLDTKMHLVGSGAGVTGRTALIIKNNTADSGAMLQVVNSAGKGFILEADGPSYIAGESAAFYTQGGLNMNFSTDGDVANGGSSYMNFATGGWQASNERMRILANGNVGIGDTTPASLFTVGNGDLFQVNTSGQIVAGTWQGTAIADAYISSAATWNAKQNAYANLTSIGSLANGAGWLYNNGSGTFSYSTPTYSDVGAQQLNSNLTSLAGLTYASGTPFVKMTGANTFALDTNTYLTSYTETDPRLPAAGTSGNLLQSNGTAWVSWTPNYLTANQTITLSGDVSGSGTTAITATVADDSHAHTSTTLPATISYLGSDIDLASAEITGILGLANGGTNANLTASNGGLVWTDADSMEVLSGTATAGLALISGANATPSWFTPTAGSVLFAGTGGILQQDNANFFWDDANNRLGIGTTSPNQKLEIDYGNIRFNQESAPGAPTVAVNATAGNLNGTYYYRITFVTPSGETGAGARSSSVAPVSQQVDLTNIPTGTAGKVTARNIYRTAAGNSIEQFVATINDNTTTIYTDNLGDGSLGSNVPYRNTTGGVGYLGSSMNMEADSFVTIFGYNSGSVNAAQHNSFFGYQSGRNTSYGTDNTFLGYQAGYTNTTGSGNFFGGYEAGYGAGSATGGFNNAIGLRAGRNYTSGSYNQLIGSWAGDNISTGSYNIMMGSEAGHFSRTGSSNIFIGHNSGRGTVAYDGTDNNIAIGHQAGYSLTSNQDGNVFLGYQAGYNETNSNRLYIENSNSAAPLIYGDFSTDYVKINGSLDVGTGFSINSTGSITAGAWNGTAVAAQYGGTGINTAASTGVPYISSGTWSVDTNYLSLTHGGTNANLTASNGGLVWTDADSMEVLSGTATAGLALISGANATPSWFAPTAGSILFAGTGGILQQDNNNFFWDDANNRLGIGTTSPSQKLEIDYGNIRFNQESAPGAPTVAVNATAGNLNGTYYYRITFVTPSGETEVGSASSGVSPASQQVDLTNIPLGSSNVTARRIYRTTSGGAYYISRQVATINDNSTTTYTDNTADGSLGAYAPGINTTGGSVYLGTTQFVASGNLSTAYGLNALRLGQGLSNTAFGASVLYNNTGGFNNTALGQSSMFSTTTGQANTAIGQGALYFNTTGSFNTAIGRQAMNYTQSGSNNTVIGYNAGAGVAGNSFSGNAILGYSAGSGLTTGNNNLLFGTNAGDNLTSGSSNIIIGYDIDAQSATGSSQLSIGNLIFGTGGFGTGTTVGSGNIGIGVTNPSQKISIGGSLGIRESTGSTYYTIFQGGDQSADITYTLPTASTNGILTNTAGTLSWETYVGLTNPMTAIGDMIYGGASGTPTRLAANANSGLALVSGGAGAPSWYAPTLGSVLFAGANGALTQDNANFFWDDTNNYLYLGSNFSLGVDATDSNKFKIYSGTGIAGTSEFSIDTNGVTSIANLEMGAQNFADNSGITSWVDMAVTSAASNGTVESYSAQLDGNTMLTIYGTSDGAGGTSNRSVRMGAPLGIIETGTTPTYYSYFQGGDQSADITYTLPTASSNGFLSNATGTLSWTSAAADTFTQYALLAGRSGGQTLIGGTGTTDDLILRTTSGVGASGADMIFQTGSNGGTEAMRILYNGNISVGTTGGTRKFAIDASGSGDFALEGGSGAAIATIEGDTESSVYFYGDSGFRGSVGYNGTNDGIMISGSAGGSGMFVGSSNNVGIGTTTPAGRLHGYISNAAVTTSSYDGYFENLATNTTTNAINKYGLYVTSTGSFTGGAGTATNNYGLYINTVSGADNNFGAYIDGNVGIGIAPISNNALYVGDSGAKTGGSRAVDISNTATNVTTDGINKFGIRITSTGSFTGSTGTATNNYGLFINTATGGDNNYQIYDQSGAYLDTAGTWTNAPSYRRYKENFTGTESYLDRLMTLDVFEWQYKNETIDGLNRYANDQNRHTSPFLDDFYDTFHLGTGSGYNIQDLAGVTLASVKELNRRFIDAGEAQAAFNGNLVFKTSENITTVRELQESVDVQLGSVGSDMNTFNTILSDNRTLLADHEIRLKSVEEKLVSLQTDLADLNVQTKTILEFLAVTDGNFDLMEGKLEASGVVAGAFTVKVTDEKKKTIGSNYIEKDEQKYLVKTDAITETAKVFTSFQTNPNGYDWIEKVKDPETDEYVGFTMHLSAPVTTRVYFDWWLVEQSGSAENDNVHSVPEPIIPPIPEIPTPPEPETIIPETATPETTIVPEVLTETITP